MPSHLRGLPSCSRTAGAENSEESVGSEWKGSMEDRKSTVYTPESVSEYRTRSSSAMGMLQRDSSMTSSSVREGVLDSIGDAEKMETEVFKLRGEYNRLRGISMEKEAELERVRGAQGKVNGQREKVDVVDVLLDDFRSRTDTRIEMHDGRLEAIVRHRDALQEVERRLKVVNKGLQHRLLQTKEELRMYVNDIQDMDAMCREVQVGPCILSAHASALQKDLYLNFPWIPVLDRRTFEEGQAAEAKNAGEDCAYSIDSLCSWISGLEGRFVEAGQAEETANVGGFHTAASRCGTTTGEDSSVGPLRAAHV